MSKRKNNRRNRKSKWELLVAQASDAIYVGIDVHKKSYHIAVCKNDMPAVCWVIPAKDRQLVKRLLVAGDALKKVVYEAGPTGYGLARRLTDAGVPCGVVAPGKTPQEANPGSKTDSIDCRKLAEYAAKDMLKYITPPTEDEDTDRQLIRMRDNLKRKRKRVMQQIKSFLLYNSIAEPDGLSHWSNAAVNALQEMELPFRLRFCLDELLQEFAYYNTAMKRIEDELIHYEEEQSAQMAIVESHPGVGHKTARQFLAEAYQPGRFTDSKQVARYIGVAPRVRQSGETLRNGGVIKAGQTELRSMLIQCCWAWIRQDETARLRYNRYCCNTGSAKKAINAMARCMTVNLWNMLMKKETYRTAG